MQCLSIDDITLGLKRLNITCERVVVHSSLSSFTCVDGGAESVLDSLLDNFSTVMMPAFTWEANAPPPHDNRPICNGCNYSFYDNWNRPPVRFLVEKAGIEPSMGLISRMFLQRPGVVRSDHPWHSWAAWGEGSRDLITDHPWDSTNLPLEKLAASNAELLLVGVTLTSCTAIHVSEEKAGRRPFIRWMRDRNGVVRPVRASGCAKGFDRLLPLCGHLFRETIVGSCRMLATPLAPFIDTVADIIRRDPEITRCSPDCIRCRDTILGGPDF